MEEELHRAKMKIGVALALWEAGLLQKDTYERLRRAYEAIERWEETGIVENLREILDAYAEAEGILMLWKAFIEEDDD